MRIARGRYVDVCVVPHDHSLFPVLIQPPCGHQSDIFFQRRESWPPLKTNVGEKVMWFQARVAVHSATMMLSVTVTPDEAKPPKYLSNDSGGGNM